MGRYWTIRRLKRELAAARKDLAAATRALAPKHKGGEWERYDAAFSRCKSLERDLARARGEECAVEIDWPARWDAGAPMPHVVSSGSRTYLIYLMSEPDPPWDGSSVRVADPATEFPEALAIVELERCLIHKLGAPNDEVLSGHPLAGRGLVPYAAHLVERSRWLAELQRINSVHRSYDPASWTDYKHYLLVFHDEIFECIAHGYTIEQRRCSLAEALASCVQRIVQ